MCDFMGIISLFLRITYHVMNESSKAILLQCYWWNILPNQFSVHECAEVNKMLKTKIVSFCYFAIGTLRTGQNSSKTYLSNLNVKMLLLQLDNNKRGRDNMITYLDTPLFDIEQLNLKNGERRAKNSLRTTHHRNDNENNVFEFSETITPVLTYRLYVTENFNIYIEIRLSRANNNSCQPAFLRIKNNTA